MTCSIVARGHCYIYQTGGQQISVGEQRTVRGKANINSIIFWSKRSKSTTGQLSLASIYLKIMERDGNILIAWLILTLCQFAKGYFIHRGQRITFIACSFLDFLCSCFLRISFLFSFFFFFGIQSYQIWMIFKQIYLMYTFLEWWFYPSAGDIFSVFKALLPGWGNISNYHSLVQDCI